jgi:hypothetical protein
VPDARLDALLAFVRSADRVCPMPGPWMELHRLLGPGAPPPLILAAWGSPDWAKARRLVEQLRFAEEHGKLERVDRFLRRLPESEWYIEHAPDAEPLIFRLAVEHSEQHRRASAPSRQLALPFR